MSTRERGDVPGRDRGGIAERFVEMRDELVEDRHRIRPDDELVMIGAEVTRNRTRGLELVILRVVETDRKRAHRSRRGFSHQTDDEARIHAAGEERAERHLAHEVRSNRVPKHVAQPIDGFRLGGHHLVGRKLPVAPDAQRAVVPSQYVTRRQLANACEDRSRRPAYRETRGSDRARRDRASRRRCRVPGSP